MRSFAPVLPALLVIVCAAPAAAHEGSSVRAAPVKASVVETSDANLLAERHLALYRAAQQIRAGASAPQNLHEADAQAAIVRTSATAALPLGRRAPAHPSTDN
jgi:hypothetical protein